MAIVQTLHLSHVPPSLEVHIALFDDLKNAAFLKEQLLAANADFEYAFIDASMIVSTTHVLSAVFRAINDYRAQRLKSRNIHSEIVFALSPNNNIADSFRRFGVSETTRNLLVVKVSTAAEITHERVERHLSNVIQGTPVVFDDDSLHVMTDIAKVNKVYKLKPGNTKEKALLKPSQSVNGHNDSDETDERKEMEVSIIGMMALRGAT